MKKLVSTLTVVTALVVAGLVGSPVATAMVPPEPAGTSTVDSGSASIWGQTWVPLIALLVAVVAVAAGAMIIARLVRRSHAPHASAA